MMLLVDGEEVVAFAVAYGASTDGATLEPPLPVPC